MSSLVQLMADTHYRSISGFETLVQKEWVALGHSFTTRHGFTVDMTAEDHQEVREAAIDSGTSVFVCACG